MAIPKAIKDAVARGDFDTLIEFIEEGLLDLDQLDILNAGPVSFWRDEKETLGATIYGEDGKLVVQTTKEGDPTKRLLLDCSGITDEKTVVVPDADGTMLLSNGISGSFTTTDGKTITIVDGQITVIEATP